MKSFEQFILEAMSRGAIAGKERERKEAKPEDYCSVKNCLWRTRKLDGVFRPCGKHPTAPEIKPKP